MRTNYIFCLVFLTTLVSVTNSIGFEYPDLTKRPYGQGFNRFSKFKHPLNGYYLKRQIQIPEEASTTDENDLLEKLVENHKKYGDFGRNFKQNFLKFFL